MSTSGAISSIVVSFRVSWVEGRPGGKVEEEDPCEIFTCCSAAWILVPVAPGDALRKPDAGGWAGTFGCTFGMASMANADSVEGCPEMR